MAYPLISREGGIFPHQKWGGNYCSSTQGVFFFWGGEGDEPFWCIVSPKQCKIPLSKTFIVNYLIPGIKTQCYRYMIKRRTVAFFKFRQIQPTQSAHSFIINYIGHLIHLLSQHIIVHILHSREAF